MSLPPPTCSGQFRDWGHQVSDQRRQISLRSSLAADLEETAYNSGCMYVLTQALQCNLSGSL